MTGQGADELLMGGGATFFSTASKNNLGQFVTKPYGQQGRTMISGYIDSIGEVQQQTDYQTGALLTWTDGKARQQFPIILSVDWQNTIDWTLENNQWTPAGPVDADDKKRGVMIKQSSDLQGKLRDAIKQGGGTGLQVGAYLTIELVGEVPGQGNPRKDHRVTYTPPAQGVMMDGGAQQAPVQQQPQTPTPGGVGTQQAQQPPVQQQYAQQPPQQAPTPGGAGAPAQQPMQQGGYVPQSPQQGPPQGYAQQPPQAPVQQQGYAPQQGGQQMQPPVQQQYTQQAPQQQPPQNQQDPTVIARKLLYELNLPAEQVAQQTGLPLETVQQLPPF